MQNCIVCKQPSASVYPLAERDDARRLSGRFICEPCFKQSDEYEFCHRCGREVLFRLEDMWSVENDDSAFFCYDHAPDQDDDAPAGETASQRRQRLQDEQDCTEYLTKDW